MSIGDIVFTIISYFLIISVVVFMAIGYKKRDERTLAAMSLAFIFILVFAVFFSVLQLFNYFGLFAHLPTFRASYLLSLLSLLYYTAYCVTPKKNAGQNNKDQTKADFAN